MEGEEGARAEKRRQMVGEVLELGEELFELALEVAARKRDEKEERAQQEEGDSEESYPLAELRAAANEFFTALRLLLKNDLTEDKP